MSKAIENIRLLTESGIGGLSWSLIEWISRLPKDSQFLPSTPVHKVAFDLYEERYPNTVNKTKWEKLRGGYQIAYSSFEAEFEQKIEALMADKDNRIAYVKRRMDELYMGEMKRQSLMEWGNYVLTKEFKELKSRIDIEFWDELELSGAAAHQAATYGVAISNMMERALQLDGVPLKEHNRLWKEPNSDKEPQHDKQMNAEKTKFEKVLDEIDKKIASHPLNTNGFLSKANPVIYAPVNQIWNSLSDEERILAIEKYVGCINEFFEKARKLAEDWYEEKQQAVFLQPERAKEILIEYRDHYVNQLKETYLPVQFWYNTYYKNKTLDTKGLEREIFFFCYNASKNFEAGLYLFANVYSCYFVVEMFNDELNKFLNNNVPNGWLSEDKRTLSTNSDIQLATELTLTNNTFADLFYSPGDLQQAINILHKTTSARKFNVVDSSGKWLGKDRDGSRSVLLAWVEVLESRGWFRLKLNNKQKTDLLNEHFKGINLNASDDSLWRKQKNSTKANEYHPDFLQLIKAR